MFDSRSRRYFSVMGYIACSSRSFSSSAILQRSHGDQIFPRSINDFASMAMLRSYGASIAFMEMTWCSPAFLRLLHYIAGTLNTPNLVKQLGCHSKVVKVADGNFEP